MSYSLDTEKRLLKLIAESTDKFGVEFSWSHSHRPAENVADEDTEFHLEQMVDAGFLKKKLATKDSANFVLTPFGRARLDEISAEEPAGLFVLANIAKSTWSRIVLFLGLCWVIYSQVLSPSWLCPRLPDFLPEMLAKCEGTLGTEE